MTNKHVLIVGFGMIGCRHAQSLLDSGYKNISILDENNENIQKGLATIGYSDSDVEILKSFDHINDDIPELAIISTSAEPRFDIYKNLLSRNIKNFLLEKVVFQSRSQFNNALNLEKKARANSYCNFPNRYFDNYIKLKNQLFKIEDPIIMFVNGGNCGMGCSGIHYLDLFEYLTGESIFNSKSIFEDWEKENKRGKSYTDFSGFFTATNKKNDLLKINFDKSHEAPCSVNISYKNNQIIFYEGFEIEYRIMESRTSKNSFSVTPQSYLTSKIVYDIFLNKCLMPTIEQTKNSHFHLFKECEKVIKKEINDYRCPIT